MKKIILILFLLVFALFMTACGAKEESSGNGTDGEEGQGSNSGEETIKVGMLAALSGAAGAYGPPSMNSAELAVNEINENGGLLGKQLELVKGDTASDPNTANEQAKALLNNEKVDALFSQVTSADRNAITPTVEESNKLYFFDVLYEGGDYLENMYILGAVPEQQITPVYPDIMEKYEGSDWFIVGEDYVWPRETSKVVKEVVKEAGGEVVGEEYVPLGHSDFTSLITKIQSEKPDFVSLEVNGGTAVSFMNQFKEYGLDKHTKVVALAVDENSIEAMGNSSEGLLLAASYFHDMESEANETFKKSYYETFGEDAPKPNFITIGNYGAVHLWAKAVEAAGTLEIDKVKEQLGKVSFDGVRGELSYEADSHHAKIPMYLGEVKDGKVSVVHEFGIIEPANQGPK